MLTRQALAELLEAVREELVLHDLSPDRMILFGSYARGGLHAYSDVDIAIWNHQFTGDGLIDLEKIRPLLRKFRGLDLKTFPIGATAENFDPFIEVIEKTGVDILL